MEIPGIRFADMIPGGGGKEAPQLSKNQSDEAIRNFYGGILDTLYFRYKKKPPFPDKTKPHFIKRFSNLGFKFKIDIDSYTPEPTDQNIEVTMHNKKTGETDVIKVFRPKPKTGQARTGGTFTVNGQGLNTRESAAKLAEAIIRMKAKKPIFKLRRNGNGKSKVSR